jgi:2,4-dienoyl-CoA reductase-like NADH-dependent reductase (Old Yellow Enzyme family)/thioredoxin reductase
MKAKTSFERLMAPGRIATLSLKNRIVMASMGTRLAGLWGEVNDATIAWYAARARGGVSLVTVEATHVAAALFPVRGVIRMTRADDDSFCSGLFALAETVHLAGAKIGIQLSVGRAASTGSQWLPGAGDLEPMVGLAPSAVPFPGGVVPRAMTVEEIHRTVEMFGKAAARVKRVGFDSIELHAHFHSIAGCFLSPLTNQRTDEYGGSFENRLRFVLEIVAAMRENVGPGFPLLIKYSIDECVPGGRDLAQGLEIARCLELAGVDAIVVSQGQIGARSIPYAPLYWPPGYMVPLAEALKSAVKIPVIVGGQLGDPALAERVLAEGKADFIYLGRPLIADPEWADKVREGRSNEIRRCQADNWCFEIFGKGEMRCGVNAEAGKELHAELKPAPVPKKILIVGAGPAGMEAARVAGLRGHRVILYEKSPMLGGGGLRLAAAPSHKEKLFTLADYYASQFRRLPNVEIRLKNEVTAAEVIKAKADAVIVATGGKALVPGIKGIDNPQVTTAFAVLGGEAKIEGKRVVVYGGNGVGCETAEFLARRNNHVTIVEMRDRVGIDVEPVSMLALSDEMASRGVEILTGTKVVAIGKRSVTVVDREGKETKLSADRVVLAVGVVPDDDLVPQLTGKVRVLYTIGDAQKPARIHDAVAAAYALAATL